MSQFSHSFSTRIFVSICFGSTYTIRYDSYRPSLVCQISMSDGDTVFSLEAPPPRQDAGVETFGTFFPGPL
jgi:hypothetical protein